MSISVSQCLLWSPEWSKEWLYYSKNVSLDESVSVKITFWKVVAAINARETHTCVEYAHLLLSERDKGRGGAELET